MTILVDFESRSHAQLLSKNQTPGCGGRRYWAHPTTEVLCACAYDTDNETFEVWRPGDPAPSFLGAVYERRTRLAAHNAEKFDRFAANRVWGTPLTGWIDTSDEARKMGFPGALDALGSRLLGIPKDKDASDYTKSLSEIKRPSKAAHKISAEEWRTLSPLEKRERGEYRREPDMGRVEPYCASDVAILAGAWPALEEWLDVDAEAQAADRAVNDRGFAFDVQLAARLLECDAAYCERVCDEVARELGAGWNAENVRDVANSPQLFCEYTGLPNAQKETVALAIKAGTNRMAALFGRVRQASASIARGKLEAALARVCPDGRLRDSMQYYGGHTGRWSHKGMQPGNMPRPGKRFETWGDDEVCALADRVLARQHVADPDEIDILLRACIWGGDGGELVVCDFSGVEARFLAWVAGDLAELEVHTSGKSPYRVAAAQLYGVTYDDIPKSDPRYNAGKMATLACGYQGGKRGLLKICRQNGVDLASAGIEPQAVIDGWRDHHPQIVQFWNDVQNAFEAAVLGYASRVALFDFVPASDGRGVAIFLPSGRPIIYNETRIVDCPSYDEEHDRWTRRRGPAFLGNEPKKHCKVCGLEHTYGGKLVENIVQAGCRCLLADALVRSERAGLAPVLDVHDEIVGQVPRGAGREGYEYMHEIMTTLPAWAAGFPVGAAGHWGKRYRK